MGLAAQVFLRIRPPNTNPPPKGVNYFTDSVGNTLTLSGTGFLLKGNALVKKTHYYNKVYEQEDPFPETQIDIVRPLTVKFLSGYNTSLIFFGSTGSGKTHLIEGALNSFADDIFSDEVSKLKTSNFKLRFQTFEVYGELIKDLLQKQSDGLQVENEINQGVIVPKSDFMEFNNKESLKETLKKVFANKSSLRDKNLGEKCCIIYKFLLEVEPNSQQYTKFTWVESFGCEKLLEDPTKLTLKEGPFVSKTINAMKSLLSSCSSLMGQHFNFEQSILTELLFDEFGGNCLTSFVVNLNQSHSPVLNFQLLDIFSNLKNLILYPVKINLHLSTLLSFYRVREKKIHENLLLNAEKLKDNTKNVTANEILSTLVSVNQKNSRLLEESEKLKARLNDLSTRYDAIVLSKSNLEKTLTQNEEQNLIFKKALLDSQIDNEKLVDQSDNQNYDLTNKVMQLQNEIMETNLHMETLNEENFNLKAEIRDLKTENSSVAMEINILRENYFQLEKEHKSSLRKLDELGIELVNLVNTKTILINEKEGRLKEIEKIQKHNSFLQQRLESQEHHGYEVNTELQTLKSCSENTRSEFYLEKQKLENKNLEMEKEKLNLEKQLVEKTKAADEELAETKTYFQKTIKEQELEFNFKLKNLKKIELENNVLQKELEISNAVNSERNHIEFKLKERISQIEEQVFLHLLSYNV
ncbi:Coiled-coil domain-containing protein 78 [Clydaea vesicula]|uniref:Coiled-coil domain-containing protein 78 n=1 Tax=Clydaea vesicula TaxID=447962 RepID=A0AAD5U4H6_9FUNG|nr:Coiled-coil domain-containing protein 78 [Clydaea vesicula]